MGTMASWRQWAVTLLRIAVLTIAYAAVGVPALQLAIPPGYAAPIFPPAGFMLAAGLIYCYSVTDQEKGRGERCGTKRAAYIEDTPLNAEVMRALLSLRPQIRLDVYARAADRLAAIRT